MIHLDKIQFLSKNKKKYVIAICDTLAKSIFFAGNQKQYIFSKNRESAYIASAVNDTIFGYTTMLYIFTS